MNILSKCLPNGDLPYESVELTTKMMVKLFEKTPFLAQLPKISQSDNIMVRSLENLPGVKLKDSKVVFRNTTEKYKSELLRLDTVFNSPTAENLEPYKLDTVFWNKYLQILKRIKPEETVVNLLGPFTLSQMLMNKESEQFLADKIIRKLVIQAVCVKALWVIFKIKEFSPATLPIIMLEEPMLYKLGDVKRETEDVTVDTIVNMYAKVFQKIKEFNGAVGVQCFKKCDWKVPIEAGVDIISFDAYNNPNNLSIIADKVNNFLIGGGRINWGIVPVKTEAQVKALNIDTLYNRFVKTVNGLIESGVSERLAFNRAMVSVQGNLDHLPLIFAEKALILANQLAKRIPFKS